MKRVCLQIFKAVDSGKTEPAFGGIFRRNPEKRGVSQAINQQEASSRGKQSKICSQSDETGVETEAGVEVTCALCLTRMPSSGMLPLVAIVRTDVTEECIASIIRMTRLGELGTRLAVTSC
jgi:hypothetical protein